MNLWIVLPVLWSAVSLVMVNERVSSLGAHSGDPLGALVIMASYMFWFLVSTVAFLVWALLT